MYEMCLCALSGIIGSAFTLWTCRDLVARYSGRASLDERRLHEMDALISELRADVGALSKSASESDDPVDVANDTKALWSAVEDLAESVRRVTERKAEAAADELHQVDQEQTFPGQSW